MCKKALYALGIIFVSSALIAEDAKKPVQPLLKKGDVEKFCENYPKMSKDFEALGMKYDSKKKEATVPEALKASQEVQDILKKYSVDQGFFEKMAVIIQGYAVLRYDQEMAKANPQIADALKMIETNPNLTQEMRDQMRTRILEAQRNLSENQKKMREAVHPKDMEIIKAKLPQLKKLLEPED